MTATEELRSMLDERGVEYGGSDAVVYFADKRGYKACAYDAPRRYGDGVLCVCHTATPEQAIAATLGSELPYDELLRCPENDWHISASWDGLRKFWCIELTEEGVKLRDSAHGTLTAEQVRGAIEENSWKEAFMLREFNESRWQAIANELNATLGAGTCKVESMHGYTDANTHTSWCVELSCHTLDAWEDSIPPSYCPICGRKVVDDG